MKSKLPKTRIEATAPQAVEHLSTAQQQALELSEEAEHATGPQRERLIKAAKRAGGQKPD